MILHTLIYAFSPSMTEQDRGGFFTELHDIVMRSGLAEEFTHQLHLPLPMDEYAPVFAADAVAQITCKDLETLQALSGLAELQSFIARRQALAPYRTVWVNHRPASAG